jgi:exosortase A
VTPLPSIWGVAAIASLVLAWLVGELTGVLAIQHLAVIGLVSATALAFFGPEVMRILAFPVLYLFLALQVGDVFIPKLMTWTADFSVMALEFLGVPVFRDGPYIRIPAGNFEVVSACSGIRYLLTSVVLGILFVHFSYRSWWRRAAFLGLCIVVPIVANWLRATGIIMIGHLSDMKFAAGVDHFIYGWFFFGFVMLVIFAIGNKFRDRKPEVVEAPRLEDDSHADQMIRILPSAAVFLLVTATMATGMGVSQHLSNRPVEMDVLGGDGAMLPLASEQWTRHDRLVRDWNPVFVGARRILRADYQDREDAISLMVVFYDRQRQGAELISVQNRLYEPVAAWTRFEKEHLYFEESSGTELRVTETGVNGVNRNRLIWSWYSIAGSEVTNAFVAKFLTFRSVISGDGSGAYLVALAVDYDENVELARSTLSGFLDAHLTQIRHCLDGTEVKSGVCEE